MGFELNKYDACLSNKTINGKKFTIVWYVSYLKLSHVDEEVLGGLVNKIEAKFGKEAPLTVNRGSVYEYLGMKLDYLK